MSIVDKPFEWLTSPVSLDRFIRPLLEHLSHPRVLHVGCGSSLLGEHLAKEYQAHVVNVDRDSGILAQMQARAHAWNSSSHLDEDVSIETQLSYWHVDYLQDPIVYEHGKEELLDESFDMVVDKSTLDCLLCTDGASPGLITEIYRLLRPGGTYLLVSFHSMKLLQPLLEMCPGTDWTLQHHVMERQVEDLIRPIRNNHTNNHHVFYDDPSIPYEPIHLEETDRRAVNVILCRKSLISGQTRLDRTQVHRHVEDCNDQWFQEEHPLLTPERTQELYKAFGGKSLPLSDAFAHIFTDAEREHLEYEYFLQDWQAFLSSKEKEEITDENTINADAAIQFLLELQ